MATAGSRRQPATDRTERAHEEQPDEASDAERALIQALADALAAGASVTFTGSGAGSTVTIAHDGRTFTAHGENALGKALALLPAG
jgi:hypothetical protein